MHFSLRLLSQVGNNANYAVSDWQNDISLAASKGIDAFALNIATPLAGSTASQIVSLTLESTLVMHWLISRDRVEQCIPGSEQCWRRLQALLLFRLSGWTRRVGHIRYRQLVEPVRRQWRALPGMISNTACSYRTALTWDQYNNKPFVSTFEGPTNSDVTQWSTIRSSISGGIYFVPCWTSQGPGYMTNLYDGAFSWDMWANGPVNKTTAADQAWVNNLKPKGKSFMMGRSLHKPKVMLGSECECSS